MSNIPQARQRCIKGPFIPKSSALYVKTLWTLTCLSLTFDFQADLILGLIQDVACHKTVRPLVLRPRPLDLQGPIIMYNVPLIIQSDVHAVFKPRQKYTVVLCCISAKFRLCIAEQTRCHLPAYQRVRWTKKGAVQDGGLVLNHLNQLVPGSQQPWSHVCKGKM